MTDPTPTERSTALEQYIHWAQHSQRPDMYVETLPLGPTPAGDTGGDRQVGKAWGRWFARRAPDAAEWLVVSVDFYVEDPTVNPAEPLEHALTEQIEFLRCTDLNDPGSTEVYCDYTYTVVATLPDEVTDENAKALCAKVSAAELVWDGQPIVH